MTIHRDDDAQKQTWRDLDALPRAHRIFLANYRELAQKLAVLDDPGQWLPIMDQRNGTLIPFLQEVERCKFGALSGPGPSGGGAAKGMPARALGRPLDPARQYLP